MAPWSSRAAGARFKRRLGDRGATYWFWRQRPVGIVRDPLLSRSGSVEFVRLAAILAQGPTRRAARQPRCAREGGELRPPLVRRQGLPRSAAGRLTRLSRTRNPAAWAPNVAPAP